jgi:hypothetical protein
MRLKEYQLEPFAHRFERLLGMDLTLDEGRALLALLPHRHYSWRVVLFRIRGGSGIRPCIKALIEALQAR